MDATYQDLAKTIDHSLLNPTLTGPELEAGIGVALAYEVASVCILPFALPHLVRALEGSTVFASTTIGFPHGVVPPEAKLFEAKWSLDHGAQELDMVVNISHVRTRQWSEVRDEIVALTELTHAAGQRIKVIFENAYLTDEEKLSLCSICGEAGVDWVKTSTGYGPSGATLDDVRLMRANTPASVQVKGAGGIRDLDSMLAYRAAGVTRIGATATAKILEDARVRLGLPPITGAAVAPIAGY